MTMYARKILIFFGGCSTEYAVSLESAAAVLANLDPARWAPVPVGITRDGRWFYYTGPLQAIPADTWHRDAGHCAACTLDAARGAKTLWLADGRRIRFEAAFPVLHGKNGEDGTLQGLLELAGVPVIGCGTLASALCMDKGRTHQLAALAGVAVPKNVRLRRDQATPAALQAAAETVGWPLFVKPVRAGSSFGITRIQGPAELAAAAAEALRHDDELLLEQAVPGFEVGCAVMDGPDGKLITGAVDEIELAPGEGLFDYAEKYTLAHAAIHCPARIPEKTADRIRAAACTVYRALGCRGFARVDLFLTPAGEILLNEVNTIPGLTGHSRFPSMMRAVGLDFPRLLDRLIAQGVQG